MLTGTSGAQIYAFYFEFKDGGKSPFFYASAVHALVRPPPPKKKIALNIYFLSNNSRNDNLTVTIFKCEGPGCRFGDELNGIERFLSIKEGCSPTDIFPSLEVNAIEFSGTYIQVTMHRSCSPPQLSLR